MGDNSMVPHVVSSIGDNSMVPPGDNSLLPPVDRSMDDNSMVHLVTTLWYYLLVETICRQVLCKVKLFCLVSLTEFWPT